MLRQWSLAFVIACANLGSLAAQEVQLELKYPAGAKVVNDTELKVKQTLGINGMDIDTNVEQFITTVSEVGTRGADGLLPVTNSIKTLQVEMELPGGITLSFDSGNPDKEQKAAIPELDAVVGVFRALAKSRWTMMFNKQNRVESVKNEGEALEGLDEAFQSQFDPATRKREANQEIDVLPREAVKVGDTWERTSLTDFGAGQTMEFRTQYKYEGTVDEGGQKLHKITSNVVDVDYAMDPNSVSPLKISSSELKVESSKGTLLFDKDRGQIMQASGNVHITGDLKMSINGMDVPGTLDLTMESSTKLNKDASTLEKP